MTIVTVRTFDGVNPKRASRRQAEPSAQVADWTRLDNLELRAWREPVRIAGQCPPWTWEYPGGGGVGTGGTGEDDSPPPPPNYTVRTVRALAPVFSCYFNFDEVVTTDGSEMWLSYDYEFAAGNPLRVHRFDLVTGSYIGDIVTTVPSKWHFGGFTSIQTATHVWYFGKGSAAAISKTSPYTVQQYAIAGLNVIGVPDVSLGSFWIQPNTNDTHDGWLATLQQWSLSTQSFTGATKTLPNAHPIAWQGRKMDSDGTIWAVQGKLVAGAPENTLSRIYPNGTSVAHSLLPLVNFEPFFPFIEADGFFWILASNQLIKFSRATETIVERITVSANVTIYTGLAYSPLRKYLYWTWFQNFTQVWVMVFDTQTKQIVAQIDAEAEGTNLFGGNWGIYVDQNDQVWFQSMSETGYRAFRVDVT